MNNKVILNLKVILEKLTWTFHKEVFITGLKRSRKLLRNLEEAKVFKWASKLRGWLQNPKYIFWLGLFQLDY
jgi:hypothetical protein